MVFSRQHPQGRHLREPPLSEVCSHLRASEMRMSREPEGEQKPCQSWFRSSAGDSDVWHHLLICFSGYLSDVLCSRQHKAISGLGEMIMKKEGCFHNPQVLTHSFVHVTCRSELRSNFHACLRNPGISGPTVRPVCTRTYSYSWEKRQKLFQIWQLDFSDRITWLSRRCV